MEDQNSNSAPASTSSSSTWFWKLYCSATRAKTLSDFSSRISASDEGLVRRFGPFDLIVLGIGATIGSGIFVLTGTVASDAGPSVVISFILAGAACVLNALCYAELASHFPAVVGGVYLYAYTSFNELTAFLVLAQLLPDGHIGSAGIARSLASYLATILEVIPFFKGKISSWIGHGGKEFFGGALSVNLLAPTFVAVSTVVLCRGIPESSALNLFMTVIKVSILLAVIAVGAFEVDVSNWLPFAPNGYKAIVTGATVVFFAFLGFDAVAISAEESKRPQRDLPIGILGSLIICTILYLGVCLVITGMVSYKFLGVDAPLTEAFALRGLKSVSLIVSIGAAAGLSSTLLIGLYTQARLYLCLGRDGLLPSIFAKVHSTCHTPVHSQVWVGLVVGIFAGLFDVQALSHSFSVGSLIGYTVVCACLITLRWEDKTSQVFTKWLSNWQEGVFCLVAIACCGLGVGLCFRCNAPLILLLVAVLIAIFALIALYYRQVYVVAPPGFSCPGVPVLPATSIFFNMFLFAQLHQAAWLRFVVVSIIAIGFYAFYGQYHTNLACKDKEIVYHRVLTEEAQ